MLFLYFGTTAYAAEVVTSGTVASGGAYGNTCVIPGGRIGTSYQNSFSIGVEADSTLFCVPSTFTTTPSLSFHPLEVFGGRPFISGLIRLRWVAPPSPVFTTIGGRVGIMVNFNWGYITTALLAETPLTDPGIEFAPEVFAGWNF